MSKNNECIGRAKDNLKVMVESMQQTHEIGRLCMQFVAGEQWDPNEKIDRDESGRPMITINRLANPVNIVVNKNSMEAARIKVVPFEDSDVGNAKVKNGLLRHIQFSDKSDAIEAYQWAFFCLAVCGFGYWRVDAEYLSNKSFDQDLMINKIEDPFSVYIDPDGEFAILLKFMRKGSFEAKYGEGKGSKDFGDAEIKPESEDDILVVEYWEKVETDTVLYQIEIPEIIAIGQESGIENLDMVIDQQINPGMQNTPTQTLTVTREELESVDETGGPRYPEYTIVQERPSKKVEIKQYLFSGDEELEANEWPGEEIPIIGIYSRRFKMEDGKYFYKSLVYDSIDPQRLYNFFRSQDAELMMQIPKAVWMGAEGQFDGLEEQYDNAHKNATSRLEYKMVEVNGQMAPQPQRIPPPQTSQGYYQNISASAEEIKATTGIFDPSLGAQGNEVAARAIIARQKQGDIGTYHFTTAINRGFIKTGIVLLDQIPFRYDGARTIRIVGEDLANEVVKINQSFVDEKGNQQHYDMSSGSYDLMIETGSNTITRRQEAAEGLLEFSKVIPGAAALGADLMVSSFDVEKGDDLAMRMKAGLALSQPELFPMVEQMKGEGGNSSIILIQLQKAQQQISQLMPVLQQQGTQIQDLQKQVQDNKLEEVNINADTDIKVQKIKTAGDIQEEIIKGQFNRSMPQRNVAPGGRRQ